MKSTQVQLMPPSEVYQTGDLEPFAGLMQDAVRLAATLAANWQRGVYSRAEDLLADHPEVAACPRASVRVIYEEVCEREKLGQEVSLDDLQHRFPILQNELAVIIDCHRLLNLEPHGPQFPAVGEMLGDFHLQAELGRGARGRVYLAKQAFLAGRPMILKVTSGGDQEHLQLARLQHTYIVPLYSVQDFPERGLRQLCMPCLGGATFQQLFKQLAAIPPERRKGHDLVRAMQSGVSDPRLYWPSKSPNRRFLEQASYVQAICWIGVCLAEALQYAHEQELVHLDIKPSNVLLTADCQPMLLDFHLARGPIRPGGEEPQWLGGTPATMSPEQKIAWEAFSNHQSITTTVDGRSDIYSLGLLLREALYGDAPEPNSLSRVLPLPARSYVSKGLQDILAHCLAEDPEARYPTAAFLAEDLRRHLTNRPLVGVKNRGLVERWRKWRRRRPYALLVAFLCLILLLTAGAFGVFYNGQRSGRLREAEEALIQGQRLIQVRQFTEAINSLDRGLKELDSIPGDGPIREELLRQRQRAARAHDLKILHEQIERSRYLRDEDLLAPEMLHRLDFQCQAIWNERDRFRTTNGDPLHKDLEETAKRDMLDLAVLWSMCRVRLSKQGKEQETRRAALEILNEAEKLFGPSLALNQERVQQAQALGIKTEPAENVDSSHQPVTAWDHYSLGRWQLREGKLIEAAKSFSRAVEQNPKEFWPWYGKGLCAYKRQQSEEALTAFTVCVALAPDCAACYFNRALALTARDETGAALRDYDRALEIDPHLAVAALNRGALRLKELQFAEAEADFQLAQSLGANPAAVLYNQALLHQARNDPAGALKCLERALTYDPGHVSSQNLRALVQKQQAATNPGTKGRH